MSGELLMGFTGGGWGAEERNETRDGQRSPPVGEPRGKGWPPRLRWGGWWGGGGWGTG